VTFCPFTRYLGGRVVSSS